MRSPNGDPQILNGTKRASVLSSVVVTVDTQKIMHGSQRDASANLHRRSPEIQEVLSGSPALERSRISLIREVSNA